MDKPKRLPLLLKLTSRKHRPSSVNPKLLVMYSFHEILSSPFRSLSRNMASTSSCTVHFCILCRIQISSSASSTKPSLLMSIRGTSILLIQKVEALETLYWISLVNCQGRDCFSSKTKENFLPRQILLARRKFWVETTEYFHFTLRAEVSFWDSFKHLRRPTW